MKTLLLFLLTLSLNAQEGMVLIGGDISHQIDVPDALTQEVVERWKTEMKIAGIEFQAPLRNIDRIEYIDRDYHYFGEIKDRTIYLNTALNEYEWCKRAAIVQMLFVNQGGEVDKQTRPLAISKFNITAKTDDRFKKQFDNSYIYTYVVKKLKE